MLAFTSAKAAFLFYQNARTITTAADTVQRYLSHLLLHPLYDHDIQLKFSQLRMRIRMAAPALQVMMNYNERMASIASPAVQMTREVMSKIEHYIGTTLTNKKQMKDVMIIELANYLQDIEFCISSLTLSLQLLTPLPTPHFSPSSLLRSSHLLTSSVGGEMVAVFGEWWERSTDTTETEINTNNNTQPLAPPSPQEAHWLPSATSTLIMTQEEGAIWKKVEEQDQMKKNEEEEMERKHEESHDGKETSVEWEALDEANPLEADLPRVSSDSHLSLSRQEYKMAYFEPIRPIEKREIAPEEWKKVSNAAKLCVVNSASKNVYELHLHNLSPLTTQIFPLSSTLNFTKTSSVAVGLPFQKGIDCVFSFGDKKDYAFRFHSTISFPSPFSSPPSSSSPLDIAYLVRLATYENENAGHFGSKHLEMNDEEIGGIFNFTNDSTDMDNSESQTTTNEQNQTVLTSPVAQSE